MFKRLLFLCFFTVVFSEDFLDGPYGSEYFDIAGPFSVADLNSVLSGDVNDDEIVNILDVVSVINYILGNEEPNDFEFTASDLNGDGSINILDVVTIVNIVLSGEF